MYDFERKKDENKIVGSSPIIKKMYKSSIREEEEEEKKKLMFFIGCFINWVVSERKNVYKDNKRKINSNKDILNQQATILLLLSLLFNFFSSFFHFLQWKNIYFNVNYYLTYWKSSTFHTQRRMGDMFVGRNVVIWSRRLRSYQLPTINIVFTTLIIFFTVIVITKFRWICIIIIVMIAVFKITYVLMQPVVVLLHNFVVIFTHDDVRTVLCRPL